MIVNLRIYFPSVNNYLPLVNDFQFIIHNS